MTSAKEFATAMMSDAQEPSEGVLRAALKYVSFPIDVLPEPLRSLATESEVSLGCDSGFVVPHVLATCANAIGTTRRIMLKYDFRAPCIIWACTIARSGTLKSPARKLALEPLELRQRAAFKRHAEAMNRYFAEMVTYKKALREWKQNNEADSAPPMEPRKPVAERVIVKDITVEALAARLEEQPRGLMVTRDELSGLFAFDAYKNAKGNDAAHYLEMFDCEPMLVDRKTGDKTTIYVPMPGVSISGTIQPKILRRVLRQEHKDNGFAARFLFSMPPVHTKRWNKRTVKQTTRGEYERVVNQLFTLHHAYNKDGEPIPVDIPLSCDAEAVWAEYFNAHAQRQTDTEDDDLVAAYAKLEQYAARLALVVHFVRWAANDPTLTDEGTIDAISLRAGVAIARWFCHEAERVYALLGECVEDEEDRKTIELIGRKGNRITVRELQQASRRFPTADDAQRTLDRLVAMGIGYWQDIRPTDKCGEIRGRPTREFVLFSSANANENHAEGPPNGNSVDVDDGRSVNKLDISGTENDDLSQESKMES